MSLAGIPAFYFRARICVFKIILKRILFIRLRTFVVLVFLF
jgi:hypothetical protein